MGVAEQDDPSATKEAKETKHKETFWAEPKNNNPLEKSTGMRESFTSESSDQKAEGAVNKATAAASEKAKEVSDKVSDAGSNMVEGTVEQMKEFTKVVGGGDAKARD
ncbi:hypothetical protein WJX81_005193 [Elliptochloris bilobata]|uniref:Uncharacterized protein n=1 Tax=Elliptochloris bilobata TaxID=381761 RepID=A0AAW1SGD6_9CHLO